ncbi:DUF4393 domain-containing protein [Rhodocaloribacter sp.]
MDEEGTISKAIGAVKELAEVIPVYQDLMQPAFKELGKGLETIARAVNAALAPLKAVIWGYERIEQFVIVRVAEKLKDVPEESIVTPDLTIAGPVVEALKFTAHKEQLREMYASLLATSMDRETIRNAHPAFVEVIRQLTPPEASILQVWAEHPEWLVATIDLYRREVGRTIDKEPRGTTTLNLGDEKVEVPTFGFNQVSTAHLVARNLSLICTFPFPLQGDLSMGPSYIDNLARLFLIEKRPETLVGQYTDPYENIKLNHQVGDWPSADDAGKRFREERGHVRLTDFGKQFCEACVRS